MDSASTSRVLAASTEMNVTMDAANLHAEIMLEDTVATALQAQLGHQAVCACHKTLVLLDRAVRHHASPWAGPTGAAVRLGTDGMPDTLFVFSWQVVVPPPVVCTAATPSASPTSAAAPLATSWWARDTVSLHWTELSHLMISETLQSSLFAISIRLAVTKT